MVSAGRSHTVLLRSDGRAFACGENAFGQCNIPPLDYGMSYIQVSAGGMHTVLLRSDARAVACGENAVGQCNILPLDDGKCYTQVSAGLRHTVLLRSDGNALACGQNHDGRCNIPPLDEGMSYTQVSAGKCHTVSKMMAALWLAETTDDSGGFELVGNAFKITGAVAHIDDLKKALVSQCFSEVTGERLLVARMLLDNATFYLWMTESATPKFLQACVIQCFSEVGKVIARGPNDLGQYKIPFLSPGREYVGWFSPLSGDLVLHLDVIFKMMPLAYFSSIWLVKRSGA
eukprot:s2781_g2.t1